MNRINTPLAIAACAAALSLAAVPAHAVTINGGSDLLDAVSAAQLESWLGQGPIQLTNIFDKAEGDDSFDFHAAVDGKGATFSLIEASVDIDFDGIYDITGIIGGYSPQSWDSSGDYHHTEADADRIAFVFNLSKGLKFDQRTGDTYGQYQTYNHPGYGPTFGGGHDIYTDQTLDSGYTYLWSYGETTDMSRSLLIYPEYHASMLRYERIEVFTISPDTAAPIPEPETYALMLAGLGGVLFVARRRKPR